MVESQQVRDALLRVLARRFPPGVPANLAAVIRATPDLERLRAWFDAALTADSLDTFRREVGL